MDDDEFELQFGMSFADAENKVKAMFSEFDEKWEDTVRQLNEKEANQTVRQRMSWLMRVQEIKKTL